MAYAFPGETALDYFPCQYGTSQVVLRGPKQPLERPYVAFLGGTETYGKFVPDPFPELIGDEFGVGSVNLSVTNGGVDVYLKDPVLLDIARKAVAVVVQITGAQNQSNRFYTVHPRRNDRFLGASPLLKSMFREVDFTEINFTRHLLQTLMAVSPARFEVVAEELRTVWVDKMRTMLKQLPTERVLLAWIGQDQPPAEKQRSTMGPDPLFVTSDMISSLRPLAAAFVQVRVADAGHSSDLHDMSFAPMDCLAAAALPGPTAHREVARSVGQALRPLLKGRMPGRDMIAAPVMTDHLLMGSCLAIA